MSVAWVQMGDLTGQRLALAGRALLLLGMATDQPAA